MEIKVRRYNKWEALETFGVSPVGDCTGLLGWSPLKPPYQTSWAEDADDVDLSDVHLDGTTGTLDVIYADNYDKMGTNLHRVLMGSRYVLFWFTELGVITPVRYLGETNFDADGKSTARLKFALDFPLCESWRIGDVSNPFSASVGFQNIYPYGALTGTDYISTSRGTATFRLAGIIALDGAKNAINGHRDVKALHVQNLPSKTGVTPIGGSLFYATKEVTIPLCLKAADRESLMHNYIYLLYLLSSNGSHTLRIGDGMSRSFYYMRATLGDLFWSNDWAMLTINITIKLI